MELVAPLTRPDTHLMRASLKGLAFLATIMYFARIVRTGIANFTFDDALMFTRYSDHVRHGYGLAWNPGGPHTFGLTSLPWFVVTWLASYLPTDTVTALVMSSSVCGLLALTLLSCVPRLLGSHQVPFFVIFPFVALPLLLNQHFMVSLTNGMETMLALLLVTIFVMSVQKTLTEGSFTQLVFTSAVGLAVTLTRPEAALVVFVFPAIWWCLSLRRVPPRTLFCLLGTVGTMIALTLLCTRIYFGTALPLSFYCKWFRGYAGYRLYLNPFAYTLYAFNMATLPCVVLIGLVDREHWRPVAAFMLTFMVQCVYLFTVIQIMGWGGRYYVPYLPLLFVPALQLIAVRPPQDWPSLTVGRLIATCALCLLLNLQVSKGLSEVAARVWTRHRTVYRAPTFLTEATQPLPEVEWFTSCESFARIAAILPAGATISASEVGAIGAKLPHLKIIDTSGLNDPVIAREGFNAGRLLDQKPDLIWFIHPDYTKDYGAMAAEPALLQQYTVYAHALNFGVAIRKQSAYYKQLTEALRDEWKVTYPGFAMDQYVTRSISWDMRIDPRRSSFLVTQP